MRLKVHPKGRVTIPKDFREKMGVREGDYIEADFEQSERSVIIRTLPGDWVEDLLNVLKEAYGQRPTAQVMKELRAGWEE